MAEWISVKDRLPDEYQEVLACWRNGGFDYCDVSQYFYGAFYDKELNVLDPSHWMPLPDPPKEDE